MAVAFRDVEAATLALDGSPPITRTTFPTCRAHYPGGSSGCACRLLPRSCCLPLLTGGSASALSLSRPAQASLTLRPARLLNRLKRPLSRGSSPAGYPAEPLVSYQINRQLSGRNLPPLVIRAFGAHGQTRTSSLGAARPLPPSADIGPGGQSVGQAAQFCLARRLAGGRLRRGPLWRRKKTGAAAVARIAQRRHRSASMGLFADQLTDQ